MTVHVTVASKQGTVRYTDTQDIGYSYVITDKGTLRIIRGEPDSGSQNQDHRFRLLIEWSPSGWYAVEGHRFGGNYAATRLIDVDPDEPSDSALTIA
jgi:hypothetical protein